MAALCLASGSQAKLVVLESAHVALVTELFRHVSFDSLYRRFLSPVVAVDQFKDAILRSDDFERLAIGAVIDCRLVGVAQYARRPASTTADAAIVIADTFQRQGLGTSLIMDLAVLGESNGICDFAVSLPLENRGTIGLLRRLAPSAKLVLVGGGIAETVSAIAEIKSAYDDIRRRIVMPLYDGRAGCQLARPFSTTFIRRNAS